MRFRTLAAKIGKPRLESCGALSAGGGCLDHDAIRRNRPIVESCSRIQVGARSNYKSGSTFAERALVQWRQTALRAATRPPSNPMQPKA